MVVFFSDCDGVIDVGFLIDISGSIRNERFPLLQKFVQGLIKVRLIILKDRRL